MYIENLDDAKSEIARLLTQCDAQRNVIESHRAFRAEVAATMKELRAEMEVRIRRPSAPLSSVINGGMPPELDIASRLSAEHWQGRLDATIAKLGLADGKAE